MELRLISTTYEGKERITKEQTIPFCDDAGREDQLINLLHISGWMVSAGLLRILRPISIR